MGGVPFQVKKKLKRGFSVFHHILLSVGKRCLPKIVSFSQKTKHPLAVCHSGPKRRPGTAGREAKLLPQGLKLWVPSRVLATRISGRQPLPSSPPRRPAMNGFSFDTGVVLSQNWELGVPQRAAQGRGVSGHLPALRTHQRPRCSITDGSAMSKPMFLLEGPEIHAYLKWKNSPSLRF